MWRSKEWTPEQRAFRERNNAARKRGFDRYHLIQAFRQRQHMISVEQTARAENLRRLRVAGHAAFGYGDGVVGYKSDLMRRLDEILEEGGRENIDRFRRENDENEARLVAELGATLLDLPWEGWDALAVTRDREEAVRMIASGDHPNGVLFLPPTEE